MRVLSFSSALAAALAIASCVAAIHTERVARSTNLDDASPPGSRGASAGGPLGGSLTLPGGGEVSGNAGIGGTLTIPDGDGAPTGPVKVGPKEPTIGNIGNGASGGASHVSTTAGGPTNTGSRNAGGFGNLFGVLNNILKPLTSLGQSIGSSGLGSNGRQTTVKGQAGKSNTNVGAGSNGISLLTWLR